MTFTDEATVPLQLSETGRIRTAAIVTSLRRLEPQGLHEGSELHGWSRLSIACHLRYGAEALLHMTTAALSGSAAAFYPDGRSSQRDTTLRPRPGERPHDVIASLAMRSNELHDLWARLDRPSWTTMVREPDGQQDVGPLRLAEHALLRLTEVEVHGTNLRLGLDPWSDLFVRAALPFRLRRLQRHRVDPSTLDGERRSWLLDPTDGPRYIVSLARSFPVVRPAEDGERATMSIRASSRDLLAIVLGRPSEGRPSFPGDAGFAEAFSRAFPGP